jgi:tRNA A37 threonylcarbamoyladenosine biosynthesis protein TsaE
MSGDGVTVVEWPERAGQSLPARAISVGISINDDGSRSIELPDWFVGEAG